MSSTSYVKTLGSGVLARVDGLLFSLPKAYRAVGVLLLQGLLFFAYSMSGPWIPLGLFYLLNLYFAVKYVDGRYAYFVALFAAAGKTYIKAGYFPEETEWWQAQWQFVSSLSIYLMFCYLMNIQLTGRKHIEVALDKLSILNKAIVTNTDSAILVFKDTGECIIANDAAARIFGKPAERLRQLNYQVDLGWPRNGLHEAAQTTMRSGIELKFTTKLDNAVGSALWCVTSLSQIEHRNTAYLLMVLTDITAYKEAEDAIQRADKETAVALARAGVAERKLLSISEETQQRIGRELHDDLGQHLTGVAFLSEVLFQKLKEENSQEMYHAAGPGFWRTACIQPN
jgi:PAS domain S-box-containing protein